MQCSVKKQSRSSGGALNNMEIGKRGENDYEHCGFNGWWDW